MLQVRQQKLNSQMCRSDDAVSFEREPSKLELGLEGGVKFEYLESSGRDQYFAGFPFCFVLFQ